MSVERSSERSSIAARIAGLSPERRVYLEKLAAARQVSSGRPVITPRRRTGLAPLSFGQQRLWFLHQLHPDSPVYNIHVATRRRGALNVEALARSLDEIVRRHEVLRTAFSTVNGQLFQVIAPTLTVPLPVVDLCGLPEPAREPELVRRATEVAQRPFDLERVPLVRTVLFRLKDDEHLLLVTMHHIVTDGWSVGVFLRELSALYAAFAEGRLSPLPKMPIQYADFAVWQRAWLTGEVLEFQLAYWKSRLVDLPTLELPTDRLRPPSPSFRGAREFLALPDPIWRALRQLSRREGVTLFTTLLAAFQVLLHRYTGQDDIVVGVPIAGRNSAELESLIGFFVNTLVLRTDLSGDPTFRELLARVRAAMLGAYAHQDLPFERLVDELQPQRDLNRNPLFQVTFQLVNTSALAPRDLYPDLRTLRLERGTAVFDLAVDLVEGPAGLGGQFEYSADLFDVGTIRRMTQHFQTLLESIAADPVSRLSALPILPEAERRCLVSAWNETAADFPHEALVHELFEAQVERTPDAIATLFEGHAVTYRELNGRANQVAHYLKRLGVGPETPVAIFMERSAEMLEALLGVLKAGAAYVPLDPQVPDERLALIVEDVHAMVVLTQARLAHRLRVPGLRRIVLDTERAGISAESPANTTARTRADNLAYVLYTSGSTGRPKGVMVPHRGLVNYLTWCAEWYGLREGSGVPVHSSIAFDLTVTSLLAPLLIGQTVVVLKEDSGIEGLAAALAAWRDFSLVKITPSHLKALGQLVPEVAAAGRVRTLVIGGEALSGEAVQFWRAHAPGTRIINEYGPTETVVGCCVYEVPADRPIAAGPVPIGRPIANTRLYVLDKELHPVPTGVRGELHIGGVGVARGYWSRPDLTAERFVPDPFGSEPGARLYKSGDLVRYLADGTLQFLGRTDLQVKIRGYRIEIEEIQAALSGHANVAQSVVLAREDAAGEKRLIAYVVPRSPARLVATELRAFLKAKLPEYMVPSAFVLIEELPLTPNGKVDRRALPALEPVSSAPVTGDGQPCTPVEKLLAAIWADVLNVETIGVHDNFFELGADSIVAIRVIARANEHGLQLMPKHVFIHQTIAELAQAAGETGPADAEQGAVTGPVPLTPIQHWFLEHELTRPEHWNQSVLLDVRDEWGAAVLERAIHHLVIHHDALRLRLKHDDAGWRQEIANVGGEVPLSLIDLSALLVEEHDRAVERTATELQASLDLVAGPILRAALFDLGPGVNRRLLLAIHHLATDGVSLRILLEDLHTLCEQLHRRETPRLPRKTTSFKRWAEALTAYARSTVVRAEAPYWLAPCGARIRPLPPDHPAGVNTEASARTIVTRLDAGETQALLRRVSAVYRAQVHEVLVTAAALAFGRWTGEPSLLVDLEGHGREHIIEGVDVTRTVGWFTTIFPALVELPPSTEPAAAVKAVKEQLRRIPNRGFGYGLLRFLGDDREIVAQLRRAPQAQISINYLGRFDHDLKEGGPFTLARGSGGPARSGKGRRRYLMEVTGGVLGGQLIVCWTYSANVHRRETLEALVQSFDDALRSIIAVVGAADAGADTVSDFPLARLDEERLGKVSRLLERVDRSKTG